MPEPARDLAVALNPAALMRAAGIDPDPWQRDLLQSRGDALLNCTRQAGKSTTTAAMALHEALYRPPALVLLLSPTLRQSGELFRKVMETYNAVGRPVPVSAETALRLELDNGSRILSLPGKEESIRGFSAVRLLVVDEAARVPDELYYSIRPMLAVSGGRIVALSTPFGKRGWWHAEWIGDGEWQRFRVPATDCPRISPEFLVNERRSLGEWWFSQEYGCEFRDTTDQVFSYDDVMAALSDDVRPLFGGSHA